MTTRAHSVFEILKIMKLIQLADFPEYFQLNHSFLLKSTFFTVELHRNLHVSLAEINLSLDIFYLNN